MIMYQREQDLEAAAELQDKEMQKKDMANKDIEPVVKRPKPELKPLGPEDFKKPVNRRIEFTNTEEIFHPYLFTRTYNYKKTPPWTDHNPKS